MGQLLLAEHRIDYVLGTDRPVSPSVQAIRHVHVTDHQAGAH